MKTCPDATFFINPKWTCAGFEHEPISNKKQRTVTVISVSSDQELLELHQHLSLADQTAAGSAHAHQGAARRVEL
jgi:hypothetical protein